MITVDNLCFSYTDKPFLENVSFHVHKGEIFGFLGPSGAGKSTLQKILTGLLPGFSGKAMVNNTDCCKIESSFYEQIGVDFEFPSLYEKMTAAENLRYFGSLYKGPLLDADELLDKVGLLGDKNTRIAEYSKGMKSRMNFVKSLVHNPQILFLDEPTSGLDPSNSRIMKDMILEQQAAGKTIILTTHNMEDATELCDQVAFIVDGRIKALDTPHNLIMQKGAAQVTYTYLENGREQTANCLLGKTSCENTLLELLSANQITSIHSSEPTLNDIFIDITGRRLQ